MSQFYIDVAHYFDVIFPSRRIKTLNNNWIYFTIDHYTFNKKKNVFGITASTFISCINWNLIDSWNHDLSELKKVKENADYILGEVPDGVTRSVTGNWWVRNHSAEYINIEYICKHTILCKD